MISNFRASQLWSALSHIAFSLMGFVQHDALCTSSWQSFQFWPPIGQLSLWQPIAWFIVKSGEKLWLFFFLGTEIFTPVLRNRNTRTLLSDSDRKRSKCFRLPWSCGWGWTKEINNCKFVQPILPIFPHPFKCICTPPPLADSLWKLKTSTLPPSETVSIHFPRNRCDYYFS